MNFLQSTSDAVGRARLDGFLERFQMERPAFVQEILNAQQAYPDLFHELANPMLEWAEARLGEEYIDTLIHGYCTFVLGVNRSQSRYEKERQYQFSSFDDVYQTVYGDENFMRYYHWGVFVTTFGWRHHLPLYQLYRDNFLQRMSLRSGPQRLLDLGCGSGVWHILASRALEELHVCAVDISPTSIALSQDTVANLGLSGSINYICADALDYKLKTPVDAGVSCFLLEHLEKPADLLKNLADNIAPRGIAFVTCALTAAECDHIFEFRRESEPIALAEAAGFRLLECCSSAPIKIPDDRHYLPRSMAMVLERRKAEIW